MEKEIVSCLKDAGSALAEVAKDKPSQKQVNCGSDNEKQWVHLTLPTGGPVGDSVHELSRNHRHQPHRAHQVPQSGDPSCFALIRCCCSGEHRTTPWRKQLCEPEGVKRSRKSCLTLFFRCCKWPGTGWNTPGAGSLSWTGESLKCRTGNFLHSLGS